MILETHIKAYDIICDHCKDRLMWLCEYDLDYTDDKEQLLHDLVVSHGVKIKDGKHYCEECYYMLY